MKKIIVALILIILIPSITAASYEQTAADVSPGVFADGTYAFPSLVVVGDTENPYGTKSPALAMGDDGTTYGIYYSGDTYTYPIHIYSSNTAHTYGVYSHVTEGEGIMGITEDTSSSSAAVYGYAEEGATGVYGFSSSSAPAVYGYNPDSSGVGVKAYSSNYGFYSSGANYGLYIPSADTYGVYVASSDSTGGKFIGDIYGIKAEGDSYGVDAEGYIAGYFRGEVTGVYGVSDGSSSYQCGLAGYNSDSGNLGYIACQNYGLFTPDDAKVEGTMRVGSCSGCDIAEHFIGENLEPGDVVVLDPTSPNHVKKTSIPYNKLAAGIVSTNPTLTMGLDEGVPIALAGVVPTNVIGAVKLGDLLTTSSTLGYAMACVDYQKCQGAIIGKAMEENIDGKGTITALVMLG